MGKTKHRKRKNRHKPTGMISVQEAEEQAKETEDDLESKTLPILEKLNCLADREHACAGLANLVLEPDAVSSLMKHKIVRRIAPLMLDKDERVQEAATGVLRNLTIGGGPSVCRIMIDEDVMTPLIHYLRMFSESLLNSPEPAEVIKHQAGVHEQVTHVLLNLCENTSETIEVINKECILPILTTFLNPDLLPIENVLVTAQCLCTVTEDNPEAGAVLVNSKDSLAVLEKILLCNGQDGELVLLKVLSAGTLFNISQSLPSHQTLEMFQAIASVFSKVLDYDITQCVQQLNEQSKTHEMSQTENGHLENGKLQEDKCGHITDQEIIKFRQLLEAQKLTLEILANMCCSNDCAEQEWDDHSSDDFEGDCPGQGDIDLDMVSSFLSEEILPSVASHELPKKVLQKCIFIKFNDNCGFMSTQTGVGCQKIVKTIQTRALVCLNNMLSTIDVDQLGGSEAMAQLWTKIMDIAFENNGSCASFSRTDDEFVEAASSALRSVLEKLAATKTNQCVTAEQVNLLCYLSGVVKLELARVNLMNILGIVGKIMAASSSDVIEPLQCIGTVLRDVVISEESLWVIAEALDAIFDIFADSSTADTVASSINLMALLEKSVHVLKARVKKEKHALGDRLPIVNTARSNLVRFLKYKKQTRCG